MFYMSEFVQQLQQELPFKTFEYQQLARGGVVITGTYNPVATVDDVIGQVSETLRVLSIFDTSIFVLTNAWGAIGHEESHAQAYGDRWAEVGLNAAFTSQQAVKDYTINIKHLEPITGHELAVIDLAPTDGLYGPSEVDISTALKNDKEWAMLELEARGYKFGPKLPIRARITTPLIDDSKASVSPLGKVIPLHFELDYGQKITLPGPHVSSPEGFFVISL